MTDHIFEGRIDDGLCSEIIEMFVREDGFNTTIPGVCGNPPRVQLDKKNSTDLWVPTSDKFNDMMGVYDRNKELVDRWTAELNRIVGEYVDKMDVFQDFAKFALDESMNIQRYLPGEGYHVWHCEASGPKSTQRVLAFLCYFNTVTVGGGTEFKHQKHIEPAIAGKILIFPAYYTHTHRGVASPTQTKYIAAGWYSFLSDQ